MTKTSRRLTPENTTLVVIDIQDKLLAKLPRAAELVKNAGFLIDTAELLDVPVRATEQYPKGLGPTTAEIARRLPTPAATKTAFSCCGAGTFLEELEMLQRPNVIVVGAETHVCVQQTVLDLLAAGLHVVVPADAVVAWGELDHATALRRLEQAGATVSTVEAVAFEWVRDSGHPKFKAVSGLVVARRG
ncbi:MAG TPA: isochorismatase family protein [Urbifossiella sp.]|nr:isochorismatase family protein [Urbifossiella sp.]